MVLVGYCIGALVALPVVALPGPTAAIAYPGSILVLTGITHLDGLADFGDAAVVHGSVADRKAVMQDAVTGVGGTAAISISLIGLALAGYVLSSAPVAVAVGIVIAAEVGAKLSMVGIAVIGDPTHSGMGSAVLGAPLTQFLAGLVLASPAVFVAWPVLTPAAALVGALFGGMAVAGAASRLLDGVSGDVFGATNELARVVALHMGVVAWMHY